MGSARRSSWCAPPVGQEMRRDSGAGQYGKPASGITRAPRSPSRKASRKRAHAPPEGLLGLNDIGGLPGWMPFTRSGRKRTHAERGHRKLE